jgi:NTP pyrophosphatase (non-canonical NTP hydrolase)
LEIKEAQQLAWANKIAKGFNTNNVPLEFMLLHGEIAESFQAWRRAQPDLGEELADVALYLFALAEMNGVDLDGEIERRSPKTPTAGTAKTATACRFGCPSHSSNSEARPASAASISALTTLCAPSLCASRTAL